MPGGLFFGFGKCQLVVPKATQQIISSVQPMCYLAGTNGQQV